MQPPLQATQAPQPPQARIKRLVKKGRKRTLAVNEVQPRKKQISDNVGESIQEEEEGVNNINDSGFQSTMGESIYEDFDN